MSKKCAKCDKIVYPAEELKCLDKVWHKGCFKCWECGMTLNMKNYKGYNKLPYCNAHYPQTKATVVADTPEQLRLAKLTNIQSQVIYHADFEKNIKGTMTSMPDDSETKRVRESTGISYTKSQYSEVDPSIKSYQREESSEQREPIRTYTIPHNPHMPFSKMLPTGPISPGLSEPQMPPPMASSKNQVINQHNPVYVAMYDYDAQDGDEVSFVEHDRILNCEHIDEGWVMGLVERTQQRGMIPANYIELI